MKASSYSFGKHSLHSISILKKKKTSFFCVDTLKNTLNWTSLGVWWIKIHLPLQGTQVQPLVWEDAYTTEQLSLCATTTEPMLWSLCFAKEKPP